jgi:DNA polymerase
MYTALKTASLGTAGELPFADYSYPKVGQAWNHLVLVGEAPGAEEARLQRPFVGRSGQLLDKMLAQAHIAREASLIANVFRWQPPANKVDHFFISPRAALLQNIETAARYGKFGSMLCREEYAKDIDHLSAVLKEKKPKMVIALGRTSLWALTGSNGLLDKVGTVLPCRLAAECRVIPTFHPSFILRGNWKLQDEWLRHFAFAATVSA